MKKGGGVLCAFVPTMKASSSDDDALRPQRANAERGDAAAATTAPVASQLLPISGSRRQIAVGGVGIVSLSPDQCLMMVTVASAKDELSEATNSVKRRLDYVIQALKNQRVKDADIETYRTVERVDGKYSCCSEIVALFRDAASCETVHNLLVEKLDESVHVSEPSFFCSQQALENARCRAASIAVHNAKVKATDMARQLGEAVGESLLIREDSLDEKEGPASSSALAALASSSSAEAGGAHRLSSYRGRMLASRTISANVTVVFALKS